MKPRLRFPHCLTSVIFASLLSGCVVGPDYERPDLSQVTPLTWMNGMTGSSNELSHWWATLGDEELNALIEDALARNLDLEETRERIVAARAARGIRQASQLPKLGASSAYEKSITGDDGLVLGGAPGGIEIETYSIGLQSSWELDLWGRVERLVEAAEAEVRMTVEDHHAARVSLVAEVAREVVLIRSLDAEIVSIKSSLETDQAIVEIKEAQQAAGFSNALDLVRARRILEQESAELPRIFSERDAAEYRLAVLLNRHPGEVRVHERAMMAELPLPRLGLPADLLTRRPDVRRAEQDLIAKNAMIGAHEAERYPRLSISGSLALQGPDVSSLVNPQAHVARFGPSLTLPLFEGGRIDAAVDQAESQARQAEIRLRKTLVQAISEVETAVMRRRHSQDRGLQLSRAEEAASDSESLALERHRVGTEDFLSVTEARRERLAIRRAGVLARRDSQLQLIDIYAALGGGWEIPADELSKNESN